MSASAAPGTPSTEDVTSDTIIRVSAGRTTDTSARFSAQLAVWGSVYLAVHLLGRAFADEERHVAAIWPAVGVTVGALLSMPRRQWPFLLGVVGTVGFVTNTILHPTLAMNLTFLAANVLEASLCAWLVSTLCRRRVTFARVDEVLALSAVGILVNALTALIGAAGPWAFGHASFWESYRTWWSSNLLGIVLVTPLVTSWTLSSGARPAQRAHPGETALFFLAWGLAVWAVTNTTMLRGPLAPRSYTLVCLLMWASLRLEIRTVTTATVVLAAAVISASKHGMMRGDFAGRHFADSIMKAQLFVAVTSVTGLLLYASTAERRHAREFAAQSAAHLQLALEAARMGTWEWEVASDMIRWSDRAVRIFGILDPSFSGKYEEYLALIHSDDRETVASAVQRALEGRENDYAVEHRIVRPDGTLRWLSCRGRVFRDAKGAPLRMAGTVADVTEQQQVSDHLRQTQKMEAIGQLAGGVAHDFNNILSAISMLAEVGRRSANGSDKLRALLDEIVSATKLGAAHTKQLLAFARKQVLQRRPVDLNVVVADHATMLGRMLGESVRLRVDLATSQLVTRADPALVAQVIVNLAVNARDAMDGSGEVAIATEETVITRDGDVAPPGRYATIRVTDMGCGIPPENLTQIWEPFFTTKPAGKGTGLGLATVFGIVKLHQGHVRVTSTVGQGSVFEVLLPQTEDPITKSSPVPPPPEAKDTKKTILLVEDNASLRRTTKALLEMHGYEVLEAANSTEAIRAWDEHADRIALLFTDLTMTEGLDGRQLAAELRKRRPALRVLVTSGYSAHVAGKVLDEGEVFLAKPSTLEELLDAVGRSLDG